MSILFIDIVNILFYHLNTIGGGKIEPLTFLPIKGMMEFDPKVVEVGDKCIVFKAWWGVPDMIIAKVSKIDKDGFEFIFIDNPDNAIRRIDFKNPECILIKKAMEENREEVILYAKREIIKAIKSLFFPST